MKLKLKLYIIIFIITGLSFGTLVYQSISDFERQVVPPEAALGKQVFQHNGCIECHTLFGNGGYWGGDLTNIYNKYGQQELKNYLTAPPNLGGAKHKRHPQLTPEEAERVTNYLKFINSLQTNGWSSP